MVESETGVVRVLAVTEILLEMLEGDDDLAVLAGGRIQADLRALRDRLERTLEDSTG